MRPIINSADVESSLYRILSVDKDTYMVILSDEFFRMSDSGRLDDKGPRRTAGLFDLQAIVARDLDNAPSANEPAAMKLDTHVVLAWVIRPAVPPTSVGDLFLSVLRQDVGRGSPFGAAPDGRVLLPTKEDNAKAALGMLSKGRLPSPSMEAKLPGLLVLGLCDAASTLIVVKPETSKA